MAHIEAPKVRICSHYENMKIGVHCNMLNCCIIAFNMVSLNILRLHFQRIVDICTKLKVPMFANFVVFVSTKVE